jgi:hypothetical protein
LTEDQMAVEVVLRVIRHAPQGRFSGFTEY